MRITPQHTRLQRAVYGCLKQKINKTFPERLDSGLAPAEVVLHGMDPEVRQTWVQTWALPPLAVRSSTKFSEE